MNNQEIKVIVDTYSSRDFELEVTKLLKEGWKVSSTAVGEGYQRTSFAYAAILVKDKPPKDIP